MSTGTDSADRSPAASITGASEESIPACVEIWVRALADRDGQEQPAGTDALARSRFRSIPIRFAIAGDPVSPDGFALTNKLAESSHNGPWTHTPIEQTAYLELLAVNPVPARIPGLGGLLLADAMTYARASGAAHLALVVVASNTRAIRLYQRSGFGVVGDPIPHPITGAPMLHMVAPLA